MPSQAADEILELTGKLLESISRGDWETYQTLCAPELTAFEPEARGHLVSGLDFHRFYFDLGVSEGPRNTTMIAPQVRIMGEVALATYVRLVQYLDDSGAAVTTHYEETRLWQLQQGRWRHVHFHRSPCG